MPPHSSSSSPSVSPSSQVNVSPHSEEKSEGKSVSSSSSSPTQSPSSNSNECSSSSSSPPNSVDSLASGIDKLALSSFNWSYLPEPEAQKADFCQMKGEIDNADDINLTYLTVASHHGRLTWREFLAGTTLEDFEQLLTNSLKDKDLTDKKLFIMARLRRQLQIWCDSAERSLKAREAELKLEQDESYPFLVDNWLFNRVMASLNEAEKLLATVLNSSVVEVSYGGVSVSRQARPGNAELTVATCRHVLDSFFGFCHQTNEKLQRIHPPPLPMFDILPGMFV